MSITTLTNLLAPINGNLQSVKVVGDNTKRGAQGTPPSSGIYIRRDGTVSGSASGTSITITLEGGSPQWEGAVSNDGILPYFTQAQLSLVAYLKNYVEKMTDAYVEEDYYGK